MNELTNEKLLTTKVVQVISTEWYTLEELSSFTGLGKDRLNQLLPKFCNQLQNSFKFGGYHNTQKLYSESVLKALKEYQIKNGVSNATKNKDVAVSGNVSFIENQTVGNTIDYLLNNPDTIRLLLQKSLEKNNSLSLENKRLNEIVAEQAPKVEFFNDVAGSADTIDMKEVAKILNIKGIGRNKLFEILREKKILDGNNQPYQEYVDRGYFRIIESRFTLPTGEIKISLKTVVFQKGLDYIRKVLKSGK